jgi:hypothetical protein
LGYDVDAQSAERIARLAVNEFGKDGLSTVYVYRGWNSYIPRALKQMGVPEVIAFEISNNAAEIKKEGHRDFEVYASYQETEPNTPQREPNPEGNPSVQIVNGYFVDWMNGLPGNPTKGAIIFDAIDKTFTRKYPGYDVEERGDIAVLRRVA